MEDRRNYSASGSYTVSLTAAATVQSVTLSNGSAILYVHAPGATDSVSGQLTNAGLLLVDQFGEGGTNLTIGTTLDQPPSSDPGKMLVNGPGFLGR